MSFDLPVTGNRERPRPENGTFYPALDGLRALAFMMVFFQHYNQLPWGWAGVDLFFVLSGFLITGILFDTRDHPYRVQNFYVRRTLRIFPLYYGVMLGLVLLYPFMHWQRSWEWLLWPVYLGNFGRYLDPYEAGSILHSVAEFKLHGMFRNGEVTLYLGHLWSLCVEEQFYLVWPWLVFWIRDRVKLLWICAATLPICLALRLAAQHSLPGWMLDREVLYFATPFRLDAIFLGGLVALALRGPHGRALLRAARIALPVLCGLILIYLCVTPARHLMTQPYPYPAWKLTWGLSVIDLLAAALVLVAIQPDALVCRVFQLRPLRWLGRITYSAYVLHDLPHTFYIKMACVLCPTHARLGTSLIALYSTIVLAWLSFRFFERPFLNLKDRWTLHGARSVQIPAVSASEPRMEQAALV